jgi:hypothetical protein
MSCSMVIIFKPYSRLKPSKCSRRACECACGGFQRGFQPGHGGARTTRAACVCAQRQTVPGISELWANARRPRCPSRSAGNRPNDPPPHTIFPSSRAISHSTPTGGRPASSHKSAQTSKTQTVKGCTMRDDRWHHSHMYGRAKQPTGRVPNPSSQSLPVPAASWDNSQSIEHSHPQP